MENDSSVYCSCGKVVLEFVEGCAYLVKGRAAVIYETGQMRLKCTWCAKTMRFPAPFMRAPASVPE